MQREVIILTMDNRLDRHALLKKAPPAFCKMCFENINGDSAPMAFRIRSMATSLITNIESVKMSIRSSKGVVVRRTGGIRLEDVNVTPTLGPAFELSRATNLSIRKSTAPVGSDVFHRAIVKSGQILMEDCDLMQASTPFVLGSDIEPNALTFKLRPLLNP